MSNTSHTIQLAALALTIGLGGCALEDEQMVELGSDTQASTSTNGLPHNGLPHNGLPHNGLPHNGLPHNGLPHNGLPHNGLGSAQIDADWDIWLNDVTTGSLNHTLMTYLVRCALDKNDSASYTDAAGTTYIWDGELGLAPGWSTGGLTTDEEGWITSCLMSLVNSANMSIVISQRGPVDSMFNVKVPEVRDWTEQEGAFFGTMFGTTPTYYSCVASNSYVDAGIGRNCVLTDANDQPNCGVIEPLGLCEDICDVEVMEVANKPYTVYSNCEGADGVVYQEVITTALEG